ncbi:L-aspartate oxidase [bacterium BMS3Abin05]|nr:L-aspartate oxidase [bacterium BMS3Abin05]GBE27627.1 L-aspartate oxidase [bacterium BMS3Bbin03]HDZ12176.1 L-aspartate oxidase [Bacteroidota bacterium]
MIQETDFLVVGSGIAGLSFALKAAQQGTVAVLTKKQRAESNTNYAQGGIASVIGPDDSFDLHIRDTLTAGAGLCYRDAVELIVKNGPERLKELMDWGVQFSRKENGSLDLGREGGHSKNRIVHVSDLTGREVERALINAVKEHPNIAVYEDHVALEILTEHHLGETSEKAAKIPHAWGVYVLDADKNRVDIFLAKIVLLASGGSGHVYLHTTNPPIATGDGIAMAYRAGAWVGNLEFMQFHPTALHLPGANYYLISEAVRGFGGILRNSRGDAFMKNYHPLKELAPRDIVARAIDAELKKSGDPHVFLDVTHLNPERVKERFPNIYNFCLSLGLDLTRAQIPVVPAAHYMCGGVVTDLQARTSVSGLYASGEVACTGVHGANRLASNSLLEGLAFSHQAYLNAVEHIKTAKIPKVLHEWSEEGLVNSDEWVLISHNRVEIQTVMWDYVGIVRSNLRLERAARRMNLLLNEIEDFYKRTKVSEKLVELRNLATVAKLIIGSARYRRESRGLHFTTDYPERDDRFWKHNTFSHRDFGFVHSLPHSIVWDEDL